tara:strand:+ start:282 stop:563 length:282 start_codon:yes stop_codon:yes gene_type:complete
MSIERKELLEELMSISDVNELRLIRNAIIDRIKEVGHRIKYELEIGDRVKVTSSNKVEYGSVIKVNKTRAVISLDDKGQYNVPFAMITKTQEV